MTNIKENLDRIIDKIQDSEIKAGRKNGSVKLMAVSKFHPIEEIRETLSANQFLYGENRVQEACQKFEIIKNENNNIELHLIGQLQSNKVKQIVKIADCIQSVDRVELLDEIEKQCTKIEKSIKVLFELHTAEDSKSGFNDKSEIENAFNTILEKKYSHIIPAGFMTMAPFTQDEKLIRNSFITLRNLKEEMQNKYSMFNLSELSMGMSNDFEYAIQEGATIVRIGTAIFGERNYNQ